MADSQHPTLGEFNVHIELKHIAYICELISGGLTRC